MDDDLRTLERKARDGGIAEFSKFQIARDRIGLNHDDANYLQSYLAICEDLSSGAIPEEDAHQRINALNDSYRFKIHSSSQKRVNSMVEQLADVHRAAWSSSSSGCYDDGAWQSSSMDC